MKIIRLCPICRQPVAELLYDEPQGGKFSVRLWWIHETQSLADCGADLRLKDAIKICAQWAFKQWNPNIMRKMKFKRLKR